MIYVNVLLLYAYEQLLETFASSRRRGRGRAPKGPRALLFVSISITISVIIINTCDSYNC